MFQHFVEEQSAKFRYLINKANQSHTHTHRWSRVPSW